MDRGKSDGDDGIVTTSPAVFFVVRRGAGLVFALLAGALTR
jgi:hypothetical protein